MSEQTCESEETHHTANVLATPTTFAWSNINESSIPVSYCNQGHNLKVDMHDKIWSFNESCNNTEPSRSLDEGTYTKNNILNLLLVYLYCIVD